MHFHSNTKWETFQAATTRPFSRKLHVCTYFPNPKCFRSAFYISVQTQKNLVVVYPTAAGLVDHLIEVSTVRLSGVEGAAIYRGGTP